MLVSHAQHISLQLLGQKVAVTAGADQRLSSVTVNEGNRNVVLLAVGADRSKQGSLLLRNVFRKSCRDVLIRLIGRFCLIGPGRFFLSVRTGISLCRLFPDIPLLLQLLPQHITDVLILANLFLDGIVNIRVGLLHHLQLLVHIVALQPPGIHTPDGQKHGRHKTHEDQHDAMTDRMKPKNLFVLHQSTSNL